MVKGKKRKRRVAVKFYAYNSDPLGICVGVPLNKAGDVLIFYEAGYFYVAIKNLRGVPRKPIPPAQFLTSFNRRLDEVDDLRRIRGILNHASRRHKTNHPGRFLKQLFATATPRKTRKK